MSRYIEGLDARAATVKVYSRALRYYSHWLADHGITAPVREDVLAWREYICSRYKAPTAIAYLSAVKMFYRWTADEWLYPNIAAGCRPVPPHIGQ